MKLFSKTKLCSISNLSSLFILRLFLEANKEPGGVLPYMAYTGMCKWTGYGFWPLCPKQGMWIRASLS